MRTQSAALEKADLRLPPGFEVAEARGLTLLEWAVRRLARVCPEVAVADRRRARKSAIPDARPVDDGEGRGPQAGILGAARAYPGRPLLVLACDLPLVPAELLAELERELEHHDWVVARTARGLEPTCAAYSPVALEELRRLAGEGTFALHRLDRDSRLRRRVLEGKQLERFGPPERLFLNLNTPADLTALAR